MRTKILIFVFLFLFGGGVVFAQLPTDAVELIFPGGDGVMAESSNYYYSPTENTFYFQKTVRIPGQGRVTTYTPVPADEIEPSISNLAVPYGFQLPGNEGQASPSLEIDNNFKLNFASMFTEIGRNVARNITFSQGLAMSIFAVLYVWSLVSSPSGGKKPSRTRSGPYDPEKAVQRRLKKDLNEWGLFHGGYTARQILRNKDLLSEYYNDRYSM